MRNTNSTWIMRQELGDTSRRRRWLSLGSALDSVQRRCSLESARRHMRTHFGRMSSTVPMQELDLLQKRCGYNYGATSIASISRANAPQPMAPAEKPRKFAGIDFKRWQQKMFFYQQHYVFEGLIVNDAFQVAAIIEKLPPIWKDFKTT
ncbi:hypothetical protein FXO37_29519 [Capsicum annuum]|nr:hypothetical protein FXO37_29519 [Capsicum annuum]